MTMASDPDGQLIFGEQVPLPDTPAFTLTNHTDLKGLYVTLTALRPEHVSKLWNQFDPPNNPDMWKYLRLATPKTEDDLQEEFKRLEAMDRVLFTILADPARLSPRPGGSQQETHAGQGHTEPLGCIAFHDVIRAYRSTEVGAVIFSPKLQRTAAATEVHYLLLQLAFEGPPPLRGVDSPRLPNGTEEPAYRRVVWKCDAKNTNSRRAAQRLGFVYEGTFRNHMIVRGRSRDSDFLSITSDEWPEIRAGVEAWLEEGNFDVGGRQRRALDEIRASVSNREVLGQ